MDVLEWWFVFLAFLSIVWHYKLLKNKINQDINGPFMALITRAHVLDFFWSFATKCLCWPPFSVYWAVVIVISHWLWAHCCTLCCGDQSCMQIRLGSGLSLMRRWCVCRRPWIRSQATCSRWWKWWAPWTLSLPLPRQDHTQSTTRVVPQHRHQHRTCLHHQWHKQCLSIYGQCMCVCMWAQVCVCVCVCVCVLGERWNC